MPTLKKIDFSLPRTKVLELKTFKTGKFCEIYNVKGDCYKGEWKNGMKDGVGEMRTRNGYLYLGEWKGGKRHGYGMLKLRQSDETFRLLYEGFWENDIKHGFGVGLRKDGSYYEGSWKNGHREGHGSMLFNDGTHYCGEWRNDKPHGIGVMHMVNKNYYYGEFRKGIRHGFGQFVFYETGNLLQGIWKNGIYFSGEMLGGNNFTTTPLPQFYQDVITQFG